MRAAGPEPGGSVSRAGAGTNPAKAN